MFSLEMLVKYLGIPERLEPRGHPSFHWDQDDQDLPEDNRFMLVTGFRKEDKNGLDDKLIHFGSVK